MASQELISQWCWREANWSMERKRKIKTIDSHFFNSIYTNLRNPALALAGWRPLKHSGDQSVPISCAFFLAITEDFQKHGKWCSVIEREYFLHRAGGRRDSEAGGAAITSCCLGQKREEPGEWAGCTRISMDARKQGPFPSASSSLSLSLLPLFLPFFLLSFFPHSFLTFLKCLLPFCFCDMC